MPARTIAIEQLDISGDEFAISKDNPFNINSFRIRGENLTSTLQDDEQSILIITAQTLHAGSASLSISMQKGLYNLSVNGYGIDLAALTHPSIGSSDIRAYNPSGSAEITGELSILNREPSGFIIASSHDVKLNPTQDADSNARTIASVINGKYGQNISVRFLISGTLDDPEFEFDEKSLLNNAIDSGKAILKEKTQKEIDRAKEKAKEKATQELEDKAGKELKKLFKF